MFKSRPLITVIRTVTIPTPYGEYDRLTLNVIEVRSNPSGFLLQVSAANDDFIGNRCRTIYESWYEDYFDDRPSIDCAIERFDELCLEIRLENQLARETLERQTIEFNDVIKLMEESP